MLAGATFAGDILGGISNDDIDGSPPVDWVDAQLSRIELSLCASADPMTSARWLLLDIAPLVRAAQGAVYVLEKGAEWLSFAGSYAAGDQLPDRIAVGEGLLGQCAASRCKLVVGGVSDEYFRVRSALGSSRAATLVFVPVALEAGALAVLELAFLARVPAADPLLDRLARRSSRGELSRAQSFDSAVVTPEPEANTPADARSLAAGREPAVAARQGFWSTLSHELRSPLNSVIVLSQVLAENGERNLSDKQVNLARVIHGSGKDLLALVDTVALLARIEARRLVLSPGELELGALERQLWRVFEPLARGRGLRLSVELEPGVPRAILTDPVRVRQIVECLLMAGIERADGPLVRVRIGRRESGWS
ncbi:MAG TPA: HAMP domain-containing sensor histidine kinase, partial [Polyangiales bacterium]|nr:HAMP domain-containing sensor histidine kinase [Polyangiales bacterium]